ncbi:ATP-binding protein [Paraburkholderia sp.]|uniref:sensor histidine kinase n=1 Tax=Paraburkholderia sp. TaxID=1926495 RepID=UPI0023A4E53F|nr:ATP-binding protein [Paraburkholderia sp.]MDE1182138.1 PAS domain S-box protein [Paraburkholderia sp.]
MQTDRSPVPVNRPCPNDYVPFAPIRRSLPRVAPHAAPHRDPAVTDIRVNALRTARRDPRVLLSLAAGIALVVFAIDALTPLDIAIAVFYVTVVLIVAYTRHRAATIGAGWACVVLTLLGFMLSHDDSYSGGAIARCAVSLLAIVTTSILALRNQTATNLLREQVDLLNLAHDAIVAYDMNDRITFWNHGAEALYGWTSQEAIGQPVHRLTHTSFPAPLEEIRAELLHTDHWQGELQRLRRDGSVVIVSSRWALWRDANGTPRAVLATNNDITGRKQMEQALARSTAELAHVTRVTMLGELAASIAHEVTQPIAAISTCGSAALRWLTRPTPDVAEARQSVAQMVRDAQRAGDVIQQIRSMATKRDRQPKRLDLNAVVGESIELVRRELERHRVELSVDLTAHAPMVCCDRVQLQQVLINLLMNAAQAIADANRELRQIHVSTAILDPDQGDDANLAQVTVRDSGSGIRAENAGRLFSAFFTTKTEGMGMGLSICRSIVEANGGRIWAESPDGGGAILRFVLPVDAGSCDEQ